jgi:hypothetical protein
MPTEDTAMEYVHRMTAAERTDYVYRDLAAVSPYVRRSMLVYNCVASEYLQTDPHTQQQVTRRVLWMTTSHPFFPVVQRIVDRRYSCVPIHRSSLEGIPMRGVDAEIVEQAAAFIWECFLADTERYFVYTEEGTRIGTPVEEVSVTDTSSSNVPTEESPLAVDAPASIVHDPAPVPAAAAADASPVLIGNDQHAHLYANPVLAVSVPDRLKAE